MEGWIKLYRKSRDNFLYKTSKPHTRREAWEDMLMLVNIEDSVAIFGNEKITCNRGQSLMSLEHWGKIFNWEKTKVKRFFQLLEKEKMIVTENVHKTTRLTICNYDLYQGGRNLDATTMQPECNDDATQTQPIEEEQEEKEPKKVKKEIKKKKPFIPPELDEVKFYFLEKGYREDVAVKFYDSYSVADWINSQGKPVLNWKQTAINVWFKDENKIGVRNEKANGYHKADRDAETRRAAADLERRVIENTERTKRGNPGEISGADGLHGTNELFNLSSPI